MFAWLLDAAYLMFLAAISPWLIVRRLRQKKTIAGLGVKLSGDLKLEQPRRPCLWFHAVSVGEVLQLQTLLTRMQPLYPEHEIVITTTTGTGYDVALKKYPHCTVHYFPLDFSWAVRRALRQLRPSLIVLVELELWPNFLNAAKAASVPVAVINGRISEASFKNYQRFAWLLRPLFESCSLIAAQSPAHAERFLQLGAAPARVFQTGNIKYDGIETDRLNSHTQNLRAFFGIAPDELVFLAGSTQSPEEEFAIQAWETLRGEHTHLRLLLVPRHMERFEEVAELITSRGHDIVRRSLGPEARGARPEENKLELPDSSTRLTPLASSPILLLDTLGELSRAWGLADIAFVGGSLTDRGGQNMIEPAGYGAAVLFGPNTWNFQDVTTALLSREAAVVVRNADELTDVMRELLRDELTRRRLGVSARQFVLSQQGAADRTIALLARVLRRELEISQRINHAA